MNHMKPIGILIAVIGSLLVIFVSNFVSATSIPYKAAPPYSPPPECNDTISLKGYMKCSNFERRNGESGEVIKRHNRNYGSPCDAQDYSSLIGKQLKSSIYYPLNAEIYLNRIPKTPKQGLSVALSRYSVVLEVSCS